MEQQLQDMPQDLRAALDEAVQRVVALADPDLVILFGSYAEGRPRQDSDVDLLVVADTPDPFDLGVALRMALRPVLGLTPLDIVVVRRAAWPQAQRLRGMVGQAASRHGVRLYERAA